MDMLNNKQDGVDPVQPTHQLKRPANMTDAEWERLNKPRVDVLTFLQNINQRLKNAQTANQPTTVSKVTEEIDDYIAHLGSGRVEGARVEHRNGKERAVVV